MSPQCQNAPSSIAKGGAMDTITGYLTNDHKRCDALFIEAENYVNTDLWDRAEVCFQQFYQALEQHFAMEEQVLFPTFETAIGSADGPTSVMRVEHQQLRGIISMLKDGLARRDKNVFLGHSDTLNIMLQQHNLKEENILYLMTDRVLSAQKNDVVNAMKQIGSLV
jgi:hemerythrin superfamily protein